ncbi:MAG: glycosyltransferase family 4 protein [Patescibacteria group bacterium]|nr:glycosyltransferase family 4 protein [Patescibacteria group bacterium]
MKKILIFSLAYYPNVGGAEVAIKEITDRIADIEFHLVCLHFGKAHVPLPNTERLGNVVVHRIGFKNQSRLNKFLFQFLAALKGSVLHRTHHFGATWAMMAHSAGVPGALFKMTHPKVPFILTLQEGDPPEYIERVMRPLWPLFVRAFRTADVVQAISTFLGDWARRRGFTGPLEIIPNGVDISRFAKTLVPHEGRVLITTSRLVHKNAIDDVIRALPQLPGMRFKIFGTGPDEPALRALAAQLKVEDRVEFLGHVDHAHMPAHLHAADIFVRPSRSEGMGNSFVEAMAAGLPVIATREGGLADFVTSEVAWPVRKDNPKDIARAVKDILGNPERAARVVETARRLAFSKYDWALIARDMRERVFARVL